MKNIIKKLFASLLLAALLPSVGLAQSFTNKINTYGVLGDGTLFIELREEVGPPECNQFQIRVPSNSPNYDGVFRVLEIAQNSASRRSAVTTYALVSGFIDTCFGSHPTLGGNSFFHPARLEIY